MAADYLALAQSSAHPNFSAADQINTGSAMETLASQQRKQQDMERQYRSQWWKRGLAKGAVGAVSGAIQGGLKGGLPGAAAGAGAGLAGGFGGEALNHAAFKDQNESMGDAGASLGAMAGQGLGSYLSKPNVGFDQSDVTDEFSKGNLNPEDLRMLRAQGLI